MTIFVQSASECLTDHLSHGDGLICFSLLKGLAERGHRIFAYTTLNGVESPVPGLTIASEKRRTPANGLVNWEHSWRANRWLKRIVKQERVDVVWRMHPYGSSCPSVPYRGGRPLIVGPLFYNWPGKRPSAAGRPRFGISLRSLLAPMATLGWRRTLREASLVFCATEPHAQLIRRETAAAVQALPVIVDIPSNLGQAREPFGPERPLRLIFVANLVSYKHPRICCEVVERLVASGISATAVIVGDGPQQRALEGWCGERGLTDAIRFVGRIPNSSVHEHVAGADLLLSTSIGEPYGRGIVEAMSVGTPAICHRSGGPVDVISDGVDGFLVDALTATSYADVILKLCATPSILHDASNAARSKAASWTTEMVLDQVEAALERLIGEIRE